MDIELYTDGAAVPNPGYGGWAVIFVVDGSARKTLSGHEINVTNNAMEIRAAIEGVKAFNQPSTFTIKSDSQYLVQSMNEWIPKRGYKGYTNADLFEELIAVCEPHTITFEWVRGHGSNKFNAMADNLANEAAEYGRQHGQI